MKKLIFFLLLSGSPAIAFLQTDINRILDQATQMVNDTFDVSAPEANELLIPLGYGRRYPLRMPSAAEIGRRRIEGAILAYTAYPPESTIAQRRLNAQRIAELHRRLPQTRNLSPDDWLLVAQTAAANRTEAQKLFHGFVLLLSDTLPDFSKEEKLKELTKNDSTIFKALERHRDWKNMLVVTDLTGSMSPYTAQLLLWFKLNEVDNRIGHLVFFNDGDSTPDEDKEIGETGGLYDGKAATFEEIARLANRAVEGGNGGDNEENNIEALLFGLDACPDCEEIVMIADNYASPRDLSLLSRVDRPVRIVLCGTEYGINIDYLNLALTTGGSLHTIEADIEDLKRLNDGEELRIGKEVFIIRDGKFELLKRI